MENSKKNSRYKRIYEQLDELFVKCDFPISRMASIATLLFHKMDNFYWTGFYLLHDDKLMVGPYQGTLACMNLKKDTGVCWAAVNTKQTTIVANVHEFPGHIACDSASNSEIVIPVYDKNNKIVAVLDIDSKEYSNFDSVDAENLQKIVSLIYK